MSAPASPVNQNPPTPAVEAHLSPALRYLESFPQFIVYSLTPSTERAGRLDKLPINLATRAKLEWTTPSNWMTYQAALATANSAGPQYGVGFVITPETKIFCLDVDGALQKGVSCSACFSEELRAAFITAGLPEGLNLPNPTCATCKGNGIDRKWHPLVDRLRAALPRAGVELSVSYEGLHNWGRYEGPEPAHAKVKVVEGVKIELFTSGKWFALGDQTTAVGDAGADSTAELHGVIADYFPLPSVAAGDAEWTEESYPGAIAATIDDDELLRRARRSNSGNARFSGKASIEDLWSANEHALGKSYPDANGRAYDASSADSGLAHHLAWWTGGNAAQIERLMRRPDCGLVRDKWDRRGTYLRDTILKAVANTEGFYGDKNSPAASSAPIALSATSAAPMPPSMTVPSGTSDELTPEDFWAHLPSHKYINRVTREMIPVDAVNSHLKRFSETLGMKPAAYLDMFRAVQQMGWQPAYPEVIEGKVSEDGILRDDPKGRIYNLFRPSSAVASEGDPSPWINHVRSIYPDEADHLFKWMAYRIQNPGKKINHAIVLGGTHGIGKDWLLQALRYGVGAGNFEDIEYAKIFDDYSEWSERTLLVINEARDTGGVDRYEFYQKSKRIIAAPPDTLPCRKMYLGNYYVPNVMAVVITSNNKLNGLFIDPDDRRYYVAWSSVERQPDSYFNPLWDWIDNGGGKQAVLGYLQRLPIADFNPMAPPPKTEAWHQIVDAGRNPEEKELSDAMEGVCVATVKEIIAKLQFAGHLELATSLQDRKKARQIPHLLGSIGFDVLRSPHAKDGRWVIAGNRETLYADRNLPVSEKLTIASKRTVGK